MNRKQFEMLQKSSDPSVRELVGLYLAVAQWVDDWHDSRPARGTVERALYDEFKSVEA